MPVSSPPDKFLIGLMADDLVDLTITSCDRRESYAQKEARKLAQRNGQPVEKPKTPKFPAFLYDTYVDRMITAALDIQEAVLVANEAYQKYETGRKENATMAMAKCVQLNHLVRIAANKGWFSEKERDRLQDLITNLRWKIFHWIKN